MSALLSSGWCDTQVGVSDEDTLEISERFKPHGVTIRFGGSRAIVHLTGEKAKELHALLGFALSAVGTGHVGTFTTEQERAA